VSILARHGVFCNVARMALGEAGREERLDALFSQAKLPPCPEGWSIGPPGFVGVGAPRSGTSWWFRVVTAHPDVCFVRGLHPKEVHYFWGLRDRPELSADEVAGYHRYFPRSPEAQLVGEWTPDYMYSPALPRQLQQAAPEARVLVLLRDPVDRFASGFNRGRRLAAERGIEGADAEIASRNTRRGMYFEPVAGVLEAFGRDRVLILQYERCREQYPAEVRRTHEFLGLDPDRGPLPPLREPRERPLPAEKRECLAERFAPDVRRLAKLLPELDIGLWPSVAKLV
jgi:Sulfotransferase domain